MRRAASSDLPLGGGSLLKNPDLTGAWGSAAADGVTNVSALALVGIGGAGGSALSNSYSTTPLDVPLRMPSRLSYSEGDGSSADTVDWLASTTANRHNEGSVRET